MLCCSAQRLAMFPAVLAALTLLFSGCGTNPPPAAPSVNHAPATTAVVSATATPPDNEPLAANSVEKPAQPAATTAPRRGPIKIGGVAETTAAGESAEDEQHSESVMTALRPLQVLLGQWNGNSRKAHLERPQWVWDLTTNPKQPALVIQSDDGKYVREGRLTFVTESQQFLFDVVDGEGKTRHYEGAYAVPVADVLGDDQKPQRTYKLLLQEKVAMNDNEQWQLTISQQENNRYILEVDRKRGQSQFQRVETINTMREGASFAISDTDYGDKTCIISQGLGIMTVSFQGKSYWVCCSGCRAAFDGNPEKWIAKWEAYKQEMKK